MEALADKLFLRIVMAFYPVLEKTGVNISQLHEILRVKLLMDNRRPRTMFASRKRANPDTGTPASQWFISFFTLLMGFFIGLLLFLNKMPLVGQSFYFTIFMVIMSLTLISDFTTVLIDVRDQYILLPRPVDDRTVAVSRILHIAIYVLRLALIQGLPGIIMVGYIDRSVFASLLFLVQIIEATFFCILIVNLVYLALMKSVSPQKFKDIISYFQIGFSTLIFAVYYLLPRLIDVSILSNINLLAHWWAYLLPPVWIAALNGVLIHHQQATLYTSLLAILGITVPLAGLWFVARVLAPGFNKRLAALATSDGNPATGTQKVSRSAYKLDFRDRIANFVTSDPIENAGFRITWKLAARTREFKIKAYPAFAYVPVYFLYFALNAKGVTVAQKLYRLQNGYSFIFLVYLSTIVLSNLLSHISQAEKYKSAWVYYALPVNQPGKILSGMYKAVVSLYFLPYCIILTIGMMFIWGPQVLNDAILAFFICSIYGILLALFMVKGLPFSKPVVAKQGGGKMISSLIILGFIGSLGYGHYLLAKWETVIWILIIPAALLNWLMLHYYRKQSWDSIEFSDL